MKIKFVDSQVEEDVESETGTCELCFGSQTVSEETLEFLVTYKDGTEETIYIPNFYYTTWDNYFSNVVYIDNYPKFAQWLLDKTFPEDTVVDVDWLHTLVVEEYNEESEHTEGGY